MVDSKDAAESRKRAGEAILHAGLASKFKPAQVDHKRGKGFGALNVGVMMGHGPKRPYNLRNAGHEDMLSKLLADSDIQRIAHFQDSTFAMFFPALYKKYQGLREDVKLHIKDLKWNFQKSVFSAAAFNFGPKTVTARHRDAMNLPSGFCAITALGSFDSKLGGHIVIEELGVIVEFPPGSTILLPSAVFTHSNLAIQDEEWRVSFTQFSSGALFRYADNGYRTEEEFKAYDKDQHEYMAAWKATRWERGLAMWNTLDEALQAGGFNILTKDEPVGEI
ncbi:hypothetical protein DFP72DRAFT_827189 [Ephemerocybe angulata]|uniref:Uncharacterized protein n=1 Tax=Ephemerocybe angulata TaxID=980116 RepID=A0A8H6HD94_9AGAR|nr:hypothetical protein DFP72DRAFT_827189 [Tulosesus angulatus]